MLQHNQLLRYADELEKFLFTCQVEYTVNLLRKYIELVRDNADKCNPLKRLYSNVSNRNTRRELVLGHKEFLTQLMDDYAATSGTITGF